MTQIFNIQDDKVVINKLALQYLEGSVVHAGSLDIVGNASVQNNLAVNGTITAETINVKNLITEAGSVAEVGNWVAGTEEELLGKGFSWTWGDASTRLIYRPGNRIWSSADFDLDINNSYKIDNTEVLKAGELGSTITKSNLREIGSLKTLRVLGDVELGEFINISSTHNRIGIGTDEPNASISIVDNDVEIAIGSPRYGVAQIGTYSSHDLHITSDNVPRIIVKTDGEVHVGNEASKTGVLRVWGSIHAENIVSDTRLERTSSLEFKAERNTSIYGKGILWTGTGDARQLIMMADPDRLWTSESIDINENQSYYIGGKVVLSGTSIGREITESSLESVGVLKSLAVEGTTRLLENLEVLTGAVTSKAFVAVDGSNNINISSTGLNSNNSIVLSVQEADVLYADKDEITIGNSANTRRAVKVFGPLSVGINNPDPTMGLTVAGNVSFANKKFITGLQAPETGSFLKGDICWNTNPTVDGYVGWICIVDGEPGQWLPFGAIARE
jgi:uncharacterized protein YaiE (UPF0345 family)